MSYFSTSPRAAKAIFQGESMSVGNICVIQTRLGYVWYFSRGYSLRFVPDSVPALSRFNIAITLAVLSAREENLSIEINAVKISLFVETKYGEELEVQRCSRRKNG